MHSGWGIKHCQSSSSLLPSTHISISSIPKNNSLKTKPNLSLNKQPCSSPNSSSSQPPPPSPPLHQPVSSKPAMNTRSLTTTANGTKVGTTASLLSNTSAKRQDCWYVFGLPRSFQIRYSTDSNPSQNVLTCSNVLNGNTLNLNLLSILGL